MAETRVGTSHEQRHRWVLAAGIVSWTAIAWGGRIGLLAGGEDLWSWIRIVGSLAIALIATAGLMLAPSTLWTSVSLASFAVWTVVIWSRSLVVNWVSSGSLPFKLVHTVLAAGFFALAWWAWRWSRHRTARHGRPTVKSAS